MTRVYREIARPEKLVSTFVFELMPEHEARETLTLEARDGRTLVTTFTRHETIEGRDGLLAGGQTEVGMTEGYARLDELLADRLGALVAEAADRHAS